MGCEAVRGDGQKAPPLQEFVGLWSCPGDRTAHELGWGGGCTFPAASAGFSHTSPTSHPFPQGYQMHTSAFCSFPGEGRGPEKSVFPRACVMLDPGLRRETEGLRSSDFEVFSLPMKRCVSLLAPQGEGLG